MDNPLLVNISSADKSDTEPLKDSISSTLEAGDQQDSTARLEYMSGVREEPFIVTAQHSDIGTHRQQNEDTAISLVSLAGGEKPLMPFAISLVADGMGGHADGADASKSVATYVSQNLISRILLPLMNEKPVNEPVHNIMKQAFLDASRIIHTSDASQLGGTTLTCGVIIKSRLFLAHVGDSRAYMYNSVDGNFEQLTKDHTYVQQLIDSGEITVEEAAVHPKRNLLYRAITGGDVEIDVHTCSLPKRGILVICSDGLLGSVSDDDLKHIVSGPVGSLQQKCEQLVALAIDGGTTDNISVVLTEYRF
ncbi:MAG: protein phosphatase 2C domain-containing protein [Chloroflexota bacterium]